MSRRSKFLAIVVSLPFVMAFLQGCGKSDESYVPSAAGKGKPGAADTAQSKTASAE